MLSTIVLAASLSCPTYSATEVYSGLLWEIEWYQTPNMQCFLVANDTYELNIEYIGEVVSETLTTICGEFEESDPKFYTLTSAAVAWGDSEADKAMASAISQVENGCP